MCNLNIIICNKQLSQNVHEYFQYFPLIKPKFIIHSGFPSCLVYHTAPMMENAIHTSRFKSDNCAFFIDIMSHQLHYWQWVCSTFTSITEDRDLSQTIPKHMFVCYMQKESRGRKIKIQTCWSQSPPKKILKQNPMIFRGNKASLRSKA